MVNIRNIWPPISTLEARGGDAAFGWIMCCCQQRSCKSGVTGRDVLRQGSSRMKQQNAAWPADGRSHIPSVRPPPHPRGHPASEASPPGPFHLPGKGTASISIRLMPLPLFVPESLGMQLSDTHGWPRGECGALPAAPCKSRSDTQCYGAVDFSKMLWDK